MTSKVHARVMTQTINETALDAFIDRYIDMWNEPDAAKRRATIDAQWAPNAGNYTLTMDAVGLDAIEARVTRAYDAYVGTGVHRFQQYQPYVAHHGAVRVWWEMVTVADGQIVALGHEFLVFDDDGRIVSDHQFPVAF
jgi:hypothetical protein